MSNSSQASRASALGWVYAPVNGQVLPTIVHIYCHVSDFILAHLAYAQCAGTAAEESIWLMEDVAGYSYSSAF